MKEILLIVLGLLIAFIPVYIHHRYLIRKDRKHWEELDRQNYKNFKQKLIDDFNNEKEITMIPQKLKEGIINGNLECKFRIYHDEDDMICITIGEKEWQTGVMDRNIKGAIEKFCRVLEAAERISTSKYLINFVDAL